MLHISFNIRRHVHECIILYAHTSWWSIVEIIEDRQTRTRLQYITFISVSAPNILQFECKQHNVGLNTWNHYAHNMILHIPLISYHTHTVHSVLCWNMMLAGRGNPSLEILHSTMKSQFTRQRQRLTEFKKTDSYYKCLLYQLVKID